jgi:hypothetical protein
VQTPRQSRITGQAYVRWTLRAEEHSVKDNENLLVFLDTEVFEHENFNFQSRKLLSLMKCTEQKIANIYITSVNANEVLKRIEKKVKLI